MREKNEYGQIRPGRPNVGSDRGHASRQARLAGRDGGGQPPLSGSGSLARRDRFAAAGPAGGIRQLEQRVQAIPEMGAEGRFRQYFQSSCRKTSTSNTSALTAPSFRRTRRRRAEKGGRFAGDRAIQGRPGDQDRGAGRRAGLPSLLRAPSGPGPATWRERRRFWRAWISGLRSATRPSTPTHMYRNRDNSIGIIHSGQLARSCGKLRFVPQSKSCHATEGRLRSARSAEQREAGREAPPGRVGPKPTWF